MRLSLRTLLAFEDNIFDFDQHRQLERTIPACEPAAQALVRIRKVMRNAHLGVPGRIDQHEELEPNLVAEYLDHQMSGEYQEQFESFCFSDDRYLSEVASVHQVISNVLGEPARINRSCRFRCYDLYRAASSESGDDGEERTVLTFQTPIPEVRNIQRRDFEDERQGSALESSPTAVVQDETPENATIDNGESREAPTVASTVAPVVEKKKGGFLRFWARFFLVLAFLLIAVSWFAWRANGRSDDGRERNVSKRQLETSPETIAAPARPPAPETQAEERGKSGNEFKSKEAVTPKKEVLLEKRPKPPSAKKPRTASAAKSVARKSSTTASEPSPKKTAAQAAQAVETEVDLPSRLPVPVEPKIQVQDLKTGESVTSPIEPVAPAPFPIEDPLPRPTEADAKQQESAKKAESKISEITAQDPFLHAVSAPPLQEAVPFEPAPATDAAVDVPLRKAEPPVTEPKGLTPPLDPIAASESPSPSATTDGFDVANKSNPLRDKTEAESLPNKHFDAAGIAGYAGHASSPLKKESDLSSVDDRNSEATSPSSSSPSLAIQKFAGPSTFDSTETDFRAKEAGFFSDRPEISFQQKPMESPKQDQEQRSASPPSPRIVFEPTPKSIRSNLEPASPGNTSDFENPVAKRAAQNLSDGDQSPGTVTDGSGNAVRKHLIGTKIPPEPEPFKPAAFRQEEYTAERDAQSPEIIPVGRVTRKKNLRNSSSVRDRPFGRVLMDSEPGIMFSAGSADAPWKMESSSFELQAEQYLLTAAPFRADLELGGLFLIEMIGDSKLCILAPDENGIPGIYLDYGRLVIRPHSGEKAHVASPQTRRIRIQTEKVDGILDMNDTRSLAFVDTFAEIVPSSSKTPALSKTHPPSNNERTDTRISPILGLLPDPSEKIAWRLVGQTVPFETNRETSVLLLEGRCDHGAIRNHPNWLRRVSLPPEGCEIETACRRIFDETGNHCEAALESMTRHPSLAVRSFGFRLWGDLGRFDIPLSILSRNESSEEPIRAVLVSYFQEVMKRDGESVQRLADAIDTVRR